MSITMYVLGDSKTVQVTEPDLTNKAVITVNVPEGLPVQFLINQLMALAGQLTDPNINAESLIIKIVYG